MQTKIMGTVLAPGVASGRVAYIEGEPTATRIVSGRVIEVGHEIKRFERQAASVIEELRNVAQMLGGDEYADERQIIETHMLLLEDRVFRRRVHELIERQRIGAGLAVEHILREAIELVERSESPLQAGRASDLRDVMLRLKLELRDEGELSLEEAVRGVQRPVVMLRELFLSQVLAAKHAGVAAILVEQGTPLSHATILARSFGIPVLRVQRVAREKLSTLPEVRVDAVQGWVVLTRTPAPVPVDRHAVRLPPAIHRPTGPVRLWLNVSDPTSLEPQALSAADGVGLYRSELLFLEAHRAPTEEEQRQAYASLLERFEGRPVTLRTLDVGADKGLPYLSLGPQENPALGLRAHRLYRFHPELLLIQLRAILKAAHPGNAQLRLLFPMIESVEELLFVRGLFEEAVASVEREGYPYPQHVLLGLLLEVPSAVWNLPALLRYVDFVSVGTNDLLQYFFAVDRGNANVSGSLRPEDPGALRMLHHIVATAEDGHKPLGMCGELASDPVYLPLLVGLGFRHFSVDSHVLGSHADRISKLDLDACRLLADRCLAASRADEVREILVEAGLWRKPAADVGTATNIDSVCGMVVHTEGNTWKTVIGRSPYYFCSRDCRDRFLQSHASRGAPQPART